MRVAVLLSLAFASASVFAQTPTCSDKRTIGLVKRIFEQSIERQAAGFPQAQELSRNIMSRISVNVRSVRTANIERQIGKYYCAGVMEIQLSAKTAAMINAPHAQALLAQSPETRGVHIAGNTVAHDIEFTSQLTDDRREQFVEAAGFQALSEIVFQLVGQEVAEQVTSAPSPTPKPSAAKTPGWDRVANIDAAVKTFLTTYRQSGITGAVGLVSDCYKSVAQQKGQAAQFKRLEYCAGMDLAAYRLDDAMSKRNRFPPTEFFTIDSVSGRVDRVRDFVAEPEKRGLIVKDWTTIATEALNKHGASK